MKSILNAELYELKKTSTQKKICIQIPISSLIVRSCPCVTALYYDYILEINLTKRQNVYDWFYSIDPMLSNQNRCGSDKMKVFIFYDTSHKQK